MYKNVLFRFFGKGSFLRNAIFSKHPIIGFALFWKISFRKVCFFLNKLSSVFIQGKVHRTAIHIFHHHVRRDANASRYQLSREFTPGLVPPFRIVCSTNSSSSFMQTSASSKIIITVVFVRALPALLVHPSIFRLAYWLCVQIPWRYQCHGSVRLRDNRHLAHLETAEMIENE